MSNMQNKDKIKPMKELLTRQLDYIYFFYGLSFFIMGLVCLTFEREKLRKFPWDWLGLFGASHAFTEWADMFIVIWGQTRLVSIIKISTLLFSFSCLFEFSRIALWRIKNIYISRLFYLPLTMLFVLAYVQKISDWNILLRYFLGFPSVYLSARMIYELSKKEEKGRKSLIALSMALSLYAVSTGLVVPKADFFPANLVNFDSFFNTFGIPVQLARAIFAFFASFAIWSYSTLVTEIEYKPQWQPIHIVPTKRVIATTLIAIISLGWIFTNYLDNYAATKLIQKNNNKGRTALDKLSKELNLLTRASVSLSENGAVRKMLASGGQLNTRNANLALEAFKKKFSALNCALLNSAGDCVASVSDSDSEPQVNKSYKAMPYFTEALENRNGYYTEPRPKYNERIYFVSATVKNPQKEIIGVCVIAKKIHMEPLFQYRFFSIMLTLFISLISVIFFIVLKKREKLISFIETIHMRLREIDRMKTDFISIVSHELRTPLTSIKNCAYILLKGGPQRKVIDSHEKELLTIILNNVDRQSRMISDLLDVSRIEAGVMPVSPKIASIQSLIKETIGNFEQYARDKKILLTMPTQTPDIKVYADPEHVRRILNNLVNNALKFTPENGTITVKVQGNRDEALISVTDNGIGISATDQAKLFEKFCVIAGEEAQKNRGCGLGLAITKGLVEAQNGKIWLESKIGIGTTFYFTLPLTHKKR